jgi:lysophospholipase L1-like esterase
MKKSIILILVLIFIISLISSVVEAKLVACVGASGTRGFGLPDPLINSYPAQLERLLRQFDPRWETRNFGVNGASVSRHGDIPYIDTTEYADALASEPDVVIFGLGGNAAWIPNYKLIEESYVSDFISLIDTFAALPSKPEIWLCYPLKVFNVLYKSEDEIIKNQIIPLITQIASEKELPIIDFYTAFEDSPDLFQRDGIHLNLDGTRLMAEMICSFITGLRVNPDLNSDGIVNSTDICIIVDNWHMSELSCDLTPPPFGDGIVDVQDLVALAEHLFVYPGRVGYWKLDENEGNVACDSAFDHNGTLVNGPLWQPSGGIVGGSLLFDGIDDYISTEFVLNPADGPFSVFAWIKGGAPGQAIISQTDEFNWLCVDTSEGNLMTELRYVSRGGSGAPLVSQKLIIDDVWHRVGLSWDGTNRILYVDDVEVAKDTQSGLVSLGGGLYIGARKNREPGTFWSGLIDDVYVYNRVVKP